MPEPTQIASLIVHTRPEHLQAVKAQLRRLPGLELHQESPLGKLVVVLEAERESQILDCVTAIQSLSGVLNANLVYHEVLEEPEAAHSSASVHAGVAQP
ncbi:chaperone NapD [Pseudomonas sp. UL073]|uniref:Chaperone NapD n=1 Tax=Zestomonas insulae TaxID=2809017 RepID=A0ABS2ICM2_9GAMM|nr:chaperone NapD [Pseudomonas insulae]MBM7060692.1 chaperone NapD [Pseudomonas insulae]